MSSPPVSVVLSGGRPVVNVADLSKLVPNMTPVPDGKGPPVTIVQSGAPPVNFVTPGGYLDVNAQLTGLAGVEPILAADLKSGQAWLRGAPYALTSLPGWSFSRASAAYGETSGGVLVPFASGAPRLVNGRGQLIEGARTNLCLRSQEFDNASWTKRGTATITADAAVAPDGTATADLISGLDSGSNDVFQVVTLASAARGEPSLYIKRVSTSGIIRIGNPSDGTKGDWTVDLSLLPDGWSRITRANAAVAVATEFTGSATNGAGIHIRRTVAGTVSFYVWGGQFEAGTHSSSYIPTTTASVTRPADIPLIDISAYSPAITYPLTMYARFERVVDTGATEYVLTADAGVNERSHLLIDSSDKASARTVSGGVTDGASTSAASVAILTNYRVAGRMAANDVRLALSGTLATLDASNTIPASPTTVRLCMDASNGSALFGYLSEFAIIPGAVSDANLPRLAPA